MQIAIAIVGSLGIVGLIALIIAIVHWEEDLGVGVWLLTAGLFIALFVLALVK